MSPALNPDEQPRDDSNPEIAVLLESNQLSTNYLPSGIARISPQEAALVIIRGGDSDRIIDSLCQSTEIVDALAHELPFRLETDPQRAVQLSLVALQINDGSELSKEANRLRIALKNSLRQDPEIGALAMVSVCSIAQDRLLREEGIRDAIQPFVAELVGSFRPDLAESFRLLGRDSARLEQSRFQSLFKILIEESHQVFSPNEKNAQQALLTSGLVLKQLVFGFRSAPRDSDVQRAILGSFAEELDHEFNRIGLRDGSDRQLGLARVLAECTGATVPFFDEVLNLAVVQENRVSGKRHEGLNLSHVETVLSYGCLVPELPVYDRVIEAANQSQVPAGVRAALLSAAKFGVHPILQDEVESRGLPISLPRRATEIIESGLAMADALELSVQMVVCHEVLMRLSEPLLEYLKERGPQVFDGVSSRGRSQLFEHLVAPLVSQYAEAVPMFVPLFMREVRADRPLAAEGRVLAAVLPDSALDSLSAEDRHALLTFLLPHLQHAQGRSDTMAQYERVFAVLDGADEVLRYSRSSLGKDNPAFYTEFANRLGIVAVSHKDTALLEDNLRTSRRGIEAMSSEHAALVSDRQRIEKNISEVERNIAVVEGNIQSGAQLIATLGVHKGYLSARSTILRLAGEIAREEKLRDGAAEGSGVHRRAVGRLGELKLNQRKSLSLTMHVDGAMVEVGKLMQAEIQHNKYEKKLREYRQFHSQQEELHGENTQKLQVLYGRFHDERARLKELVLSGTVPQQDILHDLDVQTPIGAYGHFLNQLLMRRADERDLEQFAAVFEEQILAFPPASSLVTDIVDDLSAFAGARCYPLGNAARRDPLMNIVWKALRHEVQSAGFGASAERVAPFPAWDSAADPHALGFASSMALHCVGEQQRGWVRILGATVQKWTADFRDFPAVTIPPGIMLTALSEVMRGGQLVEVLSQSERVSFRKTLADLADALYSRRDALQVELIERCAIPALEAIKAHFPDGPVRRDGDNDESVAFKTTLHPILDMVRTALGQKLRLGRPEPARSSGSHVTGLPWNGETLSQFIRALPNHSQGGHQRLTGPEEQ